MPPPLRTIPGGGRSVQSTASPLALTVNSRDNEASHWRATHRRRPRHPPQTLPVPPNTLLLPRRIILWTRRDPQASLPQRSMPATDHSWDGARPPRTGLTKSPPPTSHSQEPSSPPTNSPGDDKSPRGKNNGDYPIGRPTSPPAPSPTVAPTGRCSARKKETRQRLTIHSARTRSHVNTKTRPLVAKKTGATTPRDRARKSGAQKITQRSPSVSATQEQTPNMRTDTPSAPPPHREDPTQSAHYRLWGPGFLDVSLVLEEQ